MTDERTAFELTEIVFPEHANHYGTLFGGNALLLMSKAAFLAARAHAGTDVVMARCSDAQFLAPVPHRGKTGEPAFVADTCRFLAKLRDEEAEMLAEATRRNFHALFPKTVA